MNTKTIFENKQQYLAFRAAFAAAQNDPRAKHTMVPCDEFIRVPGKAFGRKLSKGTGRTRKNGWLTSSHFLLLNLICGRDFRTGFTYKRSNKALTNGYAPNQALCTAALGLNRAIEHAKSYLEVDTKAITVFSFMRNRLKTEEEIKAHIEQRRSAIKRTAKEHLDIFLAPFAGLLTIEQLAKIQVPEVHPERN
jgi:hypothetical protein